MATYYSILEAAGRLNVDYKVVYRLVREGRLPSDRVGWQFRISEQDLNAYLNAQRVKQEAVAQSLRGESATLAAVAPDSGTRDGGAADGGAPAPDETAGGLASVEARQMELNFVSRFKEKVAQIETLRHPQTKELLRIADWARLLEEGHEQERIMEILNTAFLSRTLLATMPQNVHARYTLPGEAPLVIEAKVVAHLEAFCRAGADAAPAGAEDVMVEIDRLLQAAPPRALTVAGLASPTGWARAAVRYIRGGERGNSFRSPDLKLLLIDLRTEAVVYDANDAVTAGFAGLFELPTETENLAALRARLLAEIETKLARGVILAELAQELGVAQPLLLEAARSLAAGGRHRLLDDPRHGPILVQM